MKSLLVTLVILPCVLNPRHDFSLTLRASNRAGPGMQADGNDQGRDKTSPEITRRITGNHAKRHKRKKGEDQPKLHGLWRIRIMGKRVSLPLAILKIVLIIHDALDDQKLPAAA